MDDDRYLTIPELVRYSGLSRSTLERARHGPRPLPTYRVGGRVLVKRSEYDTWVQAEQAAASADPVGDLARAMAAQIRR
jgi:excisionase family DNA binding protein